jgi:hypothetical protein
MAKNIFITKAAGESERFSESKLRRSMGQSGAPRRSIDAVITQIKRQIRPGDSTSKIHRLAFDLLKQKNRTFAARYGLKRAIMNLGPQGFPFEQYLAALLGHYGYRTYTNQIFAGVCISHEIDVVAEKPQENVHAIIEAKFHSRPGRKTGAKDAMYTYARFLDINNAWVAKRRKGAKPKSGELQSWLVTNTEVTSEALKYAKCVGITIISWTTPRNKSLQDLVHSRCLYPITVLMSLNHNQKRQLLHRNIVMCQDLLQNKRMYKQLHLNQRKITLLEAELGELCELPE